MLSDTSSPWAQSIQERIHRGNTETCKRDSSAILWRRQPSRGLPTTSRICYYLRAAPCALFEESLPCSRAESFQKHTPSHLYSKIIIMLKTESTTFGISGYISTLLLASDLSAVIDPAVYIRRSLIEITDRFLWLPSYTMLILLAITDIELSIQINTTSMKNCDDISIIVVKYTNKI